MPRTEQEIRELLEALIKNNAALERIMVNVKDYGAANNYKQARKTLEDVLMCLNNPKMFDFYLETFKGEKI